MIVNDFKDADFIACKINSKDEFDEIKKFLIKCEFDFDFNYDEDICSIQIRIVSKKVTYATGHISSNYEDWFIQILPYILNNYKVFFVENFKELYRYFNPINIHNYFDNKNVYDSYKIITKYEIFNESLLNNSNDLLK